MKYVYDIICSLRTGSLVPVIKELEDELKDSMESFGAPVPGLHFRSEQVSLMKMTCGRKMTPEDEVKVRKIIEENFEESDMDMRLTVDKFVLLEIKENEE